MINRVKHFLSPCHVFALCVVFLFCGCSIPIPGNVPEQTYYVLTGGESSLKEQFVKKPHRILLLEQTPSRLINTERIVFGDDSSERGFYQFAFWAETPPKRFTYLLQKRLEVAGLFETVVRGSSSALSDLQLSVQFADFYHDTTDRPGRAVVDLRLELIDLKKRVVLASKSFTKSVSTRSYSANGAVKGFDQAVAEILDEVLVWLNDSV